MDVVICPTATDVAGVAAAEMAGLVRAKPACVLGLASGETPLPTYEELIRLHREEGLSFAMVSTFNLDEYVGLDQSDPRSYAAFMHDRFFRHIDIDTSSTHVPDGSAEDLDLACAEYESAIIAVGGIDLQILGIGADGHIGFNEPISSLASRTRVKVLTEQTRQENARYFASPDDVPRLSLTMGIGTILEARALVLLATGEHKADAVARAIEGPLSAMVPASAIQLHRRAIVIVDEPAASRLALSDYYREVTAAKAGLGAIE
ncbi:MAG: glucosamine-6-phosphate deaminase [Actinobacteria bacterium]|nr:MAG: glucosamine-6-phosphate deaminase [Actinomycetota bacterium]RIK08403.1 MAG: glucosamine-6-phosphate deaminase [Acidobacteriota bacterium]